MFQVPIGSSFNFFAQPAFGEDGGEAWPACVEDKDEGVPGAVGVRDLLLSVRENVV